MHIARFSIGREIHFGLVEGDQIFGLAEDPFIAFSRGGELALAGASYPLGHCRLLPPCLPSKIVCLGVNYRPHAAEMKSSLPVLPLIFLKPPSAVIGLDDQVVLPPNFKQVDYEGELAVVIGRKAKDVSENQAREYVLGYTCFNDVTERQFQKDDGQWTRAKSFDTFAPLGPWIATAVNADDLQLETFLNGRVRQSARTRDLVFGIAKLISFISGVMTLLPGDVIATGTPAGVGPVRAGDLVEVKIEDIGTLRNSVAAVD
jgi:2-keto-4-pentenoate hydratase/2-oxohepta-3-ene-1,7-dioic acid hydratase in catechol pathway